MHAVARWFVDASYKAMELATGQVSGGGEDGSVQDADFHFHLDRSEVPEGHEPTPDSFRLLVFTSAPIQ